MTRRRVAILGGGPSALAAAYDLSAHPDRFQVTVYTLGWRLGGKCASSRDAAHFDRNEEHGLHLPMGFYENFFDQIRDAYRVLARPRGVPLSTWEEALIGRTTLVLEEQAAGRWHDWPFHFEPKEGIPGDRARAMVAGGDSSFSWPSVIRQLLQLLERATHELLAGHPILAALAEHLEKDLFDAVATAVEKAIAAGGGIAEDLFAVLTHFVGTIVWDLVKDDLETDIALRKLWIILELGTAFALGLARVLLSGKPVSSLDGTELTAWLDENSVFGKLTEVSRNSGPLRMVYELVFAFEGGDARRRNIAAGVAVVGLTRLVFGYRGHITYDLAAGMGDTVIVPYYQAILKRAPDTRFELFHRVRELRLSADGSLVKQIQLGVQATTLDGAPYRPLRNVHGIDCFPAVPDYAQLRQGDALQQSRELPDGGYDLEASYTAWPDVAQKVLELGVDFDEVILAIPAPALAVLSAPLAADARWKKMLDDVTGVPTTAMQLWLADDIDALGWPASRSGSSDPPLVGSYVDNLGTIADMSRVLATESWPEGARPQAVTYFCGAFVAPGALPPTCDTPAPEYLVAARTAATEQALEWTNASIRHLFPGLVSDGAVDWSRLVDPAGGRGAARFFTQYFRGNVSASEQYVTSFAGTISSRLRPDCRLFSNLLLAGDWTDNGMNAGALEAAVTSGRIAARSILGAAYPLFGENEALL